MPTGSRPLRCLLVDESPYYLAAAEAVLSTSGVDVLDTVRTAGAADRAARESQPDLVVISLKVAEGNGFAIVDRLAEMTPAPVVLLVTARDPDRYQERVAGLPVAGCIAKELLSELAVTEAVTGPTGSGRRDRGAGHERGAGTTWARDGQPAT